MGLWNCLQASDRAGGQGGREGFGEKEAVGTLRQGPSIHCCPWLLGAVLQKHSTVTGDKLKIDLRAAGGSQRPVGP